MDGVYQINEDRVQECLCRNCPCIEEYWESCKWDQTPDIVYKDFTLSCRMRNVEEERLEP